MSSSLGRDGLKVTPKVTPYALSCRLNKHSPLYVKYKGQEQSREDGYYRMATLTGSQNRQPAHSKNQSDPRAISETRIRLILRLKLDPYRLISKASLCGARLYADSKCTTPTPARRVPCSGWSWPRIGCSCSWGCPSTAPRCRRPAPTPLRREHRRWFGATLPRRLYAISAIC